MTMRCLLVWVIAVFGAARSMASDDEVPKVSVEVALASEKTMFPVIHRLADGRLAAVVRAGAKHVGIGGRLDMIFSSDEGKSWGNQVVVNDSPLDDRNPAFGVAKSGALIVGFYRTANYDESGKYNPHLGKEMSTWVTRSEDGGKTWQEAMPIDCKPHGYGSPYGRMLTLPDGSMLMAIYGDYLGSLGDVKNRRETSYVYRSVDDGRSWVRWSQIGAGDQQFNETALHRLDSGRLVAAIRSRGYELWTSSSEDDGKTWSEPIQRTPAWVHPADILETSHGLLLIAGNRIGPYGLMGMLADASGDFDYRRRFSLIDSLASRDCGYPSGVVLADGSILVMYYSVSDQSHPEWPHPHVATARFFLPPPVLP